MATILAFITSLSKQPADATALRAALLDKLAHLAELAPSAPPVPARLHQRLRNTPQVDSIDVDTIMTTLWDAVGSDPRVRPLLMELDLLAAELGGTLCTVRVGQHVIAALRKAHGDWYGKRGLDPRSS